MRAHSEQIFLCTVLLIVGTHSAISAISQTNCHFRSKLAILCTTGHNAVDAYDIYGFDVERMTLLYSRTALQQAGCFLATDSGGIKQMGHGRVAYTNDWRGVTMISLNKNQMSGFVSDRYLTGRCEKFIPKMIKYSLPESRE